jgi:hypothetical protein
MPAKQTRESIEAELSATETERLHDQVKELLCEIDEVEAGLRQLEKERGLPDSCGAKPLLDRMAHLGMSPKAIERVGEMLDAMTKTLQGKMDEIPDHVRRELANRAEAEITALDQLQDIFDAMRRRPIRANQGFAR